MKLKGKKRYILLGVFLIAVPLAIMIGRDFFYDQLKDRLEEQIHRLRDAGYIVKYDSIIVDWEQRFVEVRKFEIRHDIDSSLCHTTDFIAAKNIRANGLRIMTFLFKGHLSFESVKVDSASFFFNERLFKKDSSKRRQKDFTMIIDELRLPRLAVEYYDAASCETKTTFKGSSVIKDFNLGLYADKPLFLDVKSVTTENIQVNLPGEFYAISVKQFTLNPSMQLMDIDTIRIKPYYNKLTFGRKKGKECDRIEGIIPYVNCYGFSVYRNDSLSLRAEKITTQVFLKVFRDKRLAFRQGPKQLPIEALNSLSVGVDVEKVVLNKSFVQYEEFAEDADSAGSVYFDDLYATITNINNLDLSRKGITKVVAESKFLGQGKIKMRATIPWQTKKNHHVTGVIEDLDMKKLNRMLEPSVQVSVASGHLKKANFSFSASSTHSRGEIEMNYSDLKLVTYKSEKRVKRILKRKKPKNEEEEDKARISSLKTFILNTFIIRKDMNKDLPEDERTGTIDFDRNMNKAVFNFWWKSVLSGIKSAYKLEKIEESKIVNAMKKKDKGEP